MPPLDLRGLPIAITGASSGIGAATAVACARAGMPVALAARREDRLHALAERIRGAGGRAVVIAGDVSRPEFGAELVARASQALGPLHAVFANAGYGFAGTFDATSDDAVREMIDVNYWHGVHLARAALPAMRAQQRGHVLLCSSCLSKIGLPQFWAYSASKAMQDHLARGLRHELWGTGVHVSSVHPVGTRTEFFEGVDQRGDSPLTKTPDRLMQPPERVAEAVVACLRRPRGEVWTSLPMRLTLALAVAFPALADAALSRMVRKRLSENAPRQR